MIHLYNLHWHVLIGTIEKSIGVMRTQCHTMLKNHMMMKGSDYPWDIG